jgi:two-component system response regulator HydG
LSFATFFLTKANKALNRNVKGFSDKVISLLINYHWHGNLRELNNVIMRATLLASGQFIEVESLPNELRSPSGDSYSCEENVLKTVAGNAERQAIIDTLEQVNFNKSKAAQILNIDRKTLYNKLKLYNIPNGRKFNNYLFT